MSVLLYGWPATAKFGRVVPKSKFYEHTSISATVRKKFVSEVQRIIWAYKLADETIHLRGDAAVPEIQIFGIDAKNEDVTDDVLTTIDKAIQFPIIFEINRGNDEQAQTRMVAAHKQLGGSTPRLSSYFTTSWESADAPRVPLPLALDLPSLYTGLLTPMLPIAARPGEKVSETTSRMDRARKLEREIATLQKRLNAEPQLNRKVEVRREVRDRAAALAALTDPAAPKIEETPWRS
jgi:hypothetical protein